MLGKTMRHLRVKIAGNILKLNGHKYSFHNQETSKNSDNNQIMHMITRIKSRRRRIES
jgi:hypothetical protein